MKCEELTNENDIKDHRFLRIIGLAEISTPLPRVTA
jgi:hypothetical protein